ncbi:heterodisulfide reductase-related iron-sulfur binding cluster [Brevibacterium pityocampae]|uniref:(Fe-S)-binding protein n=1 Tax=Brevibacterium pityocampae TaxID=506594 RepID=A0ABP8JMJ2_9MICO
MRIALFATCIVDAMYPDVAKATVRILERLGHEVVFPAGQACCGQMHINSGKFREAYPVVRNHVEAFEAEDWDHAVAPSGSCVASLGHQHPMIAEHNDDPELSARASAVASRTYELAQLLTDVLGVTDAAAQLGSYFPYSVVHHSSCHGMRLLRLGDRQLDLLRSVEGATVVEPEHPDACCGFGGTFSVKNPQVSAAMLSDKVDALVTTGASVCSGGDASCLMHIGGGLQRTRELMPAQAGVPRTVHLAEILASTKEDPLVLEPLDAPASRTPARSSRASRLRAALRSTPTDRTTGALR